MFRFNKILVANDGSEGARKALRVAVELAKRFDAELHSISVEEDLPLNQLIQSLLLINRKICYGIVTIVKFFLMKALPELVIEEMRIEDLDEIIQIEEVSFPTPWPKKMFDLELQSTRSCCRVARVSGVIVGYIVAWMIYDEVHILNIAVHPSFRRMGIGESILRYCLDYFFLNGGRNAILEVRRGNHEAKRLYEKLGFKSIGIRRGYYADTGEDAIVMKLNL